MIDLAQRLKDLDPAKFEDLCFQILSEKFPEAGLKHVEGRAGDKGTDLFAGTLAWQPAIWQCKFFKDGIKDAQKKQIKKSLKTALSQFSPREWTLCVPIRLDINAHSWFQKLAQQHTNVKIELFDAPLIVKELIFRPTIRDFFFPDVVLNVSEIRAILLSTGDYSDSQLAHLADENVDQYIDRLRQKEPRYDYQLSYHSGNAGLAALERGDEVLPPNTIMTAWHGNRRLDLTVRDVEAVRKDPPRLDLTVNAEGAKKIQNALRTGAPIQLDPNDLVAFKSSFDFLLSPEQLQQPFGLVLSPRFPKACGSFRVTFENSVKKVVYDLIEFDVTAKQFGENGEHRVLEMSSTSPYVPFQMNARFGIDDLSASFNLQKKFRGHEILEVEKFLDAMAVLKGGGAIELFDLKQAKAARTTGAHLNTSSEKEGQFEQITRDLAEVARAFAVRLIVPEAIGKKDLETMSFLLEVCRSGEIQGGTITSLTATLVRRDESVESVFGPISGEFMIGVENDSYPPQQLLGTQVTVGPCRMVIERASLCDLDDTKKKYAALKPGESTPVRFLSTGSVRQIFLKFHKGEPLAPLVPV
ncbi:MAG: hypothetical protein WA609_11155 [Terriglobales bacterium]